MVLRVGCFSTMLGFMVVACSSPDPVSVQPAAVDAARLIEADAEPGQWLSHGRTYGEQRFSPLDQIDRQNVGALGLAWFADLDTHRGQEATPLVADGVLYVSTAWSKVKAYDAATGRGAVGKEQEAIHPEVGRLDCRATGQQWAYGGLVDRGERSRPHGEASLIADHERHRPARPVDVRTLPVAHAR